jgi:hypothetical protein
MKYQNYEMMPPQNLLATFWFAFSFIFVLCSDDPLKNCTLYRQCKKFPLGNVLTPIDFGIRQKIHRKFLLQGK